MTGFQTRAIHHGHDASDSLGAVVPPIYMTSNFAFEGGDALSAAVSGGTGSFFYCRSNNPTQHLLEQRLADLEGAEAAVTAASGMAAISMTLLSLLSQGDEAVIHRTHYSITSSLANEGLSRFGIRVIPADLSTPEGLAGAIGPNTRLVFFETPVNPTGEVLDIAALAAVAHAAGLLVVVDSTFASPAVQRPIEHGADLVVHSLTKYINGHGDLLGGAVAGRVELIDRLRATGLRYLTGATLSPFACFLILRSLKTLDLRMRAHSANGLAVAQMLAAHPAVRGVRYPFLEGDRGAGIARRQMAGGSGMMSFELHAGFEGAKRLMNRLLLIKRAVSLGDVESLIMHPGSLAHDHGDATAGDGVSMEMLRLSVGLEAVEDIVGDLRQALED